MWTLIPLLFETFLLCINTRLLTNISLFCRLLILFTKFAFSNILSGILSGFDPDQARHFVGPDLGPSSLRRLSTGDTGRLNLTLKAPRKKASENVVC